MLKLAHAFYPNYEGLGQRGGFDLKLYRYRSLMALDRKTDPLGSEENWR